MGMNSVRWGIGKMPSDIASKMSSVLCLGMGYGVGRGGWGASGNFRHSKRKSIGARCTVSDLLLSFLTISLEAIFYCGRMEYRVKFSEKYIFREYKDGEIVFYFFISFSQFIHRYRQCLSSPSP
jgi:hypothetical protein